MKNYIFSTLTCDNKYTAYVKNPEGNIVTPEVSVLIKGGANVADKTMYTPKGFVTEVSDEQLEFLKDNPVFKMHVKNGFITYETKKAEVEEVVKNMEKGDKSRPKTPQDYPKGDPAEGGGTQLSSVGKVK